MKLDFKTLKEDEQNKSLDTMRNLHATEEAVPSQNQIIKPNMKQLSYLSQDIKPKSSRAAYTSNSNKLGGPTSVVEMSFNENPFDKRHFQ